MARRARKAWQDQLDRQGDLVEKVLKDQRALQARWWQFPVRQAPLVLLAPLAKLERKVLLAKMLERPQDHLARRAMLELPARKDDPAMLDPRVKRDLPESRAAAVTVPNLVFLPVISQRNQNDEPLIVDMQPNGIAILLANCYFKFLNMFLNKRNSTSVLRTIKLKR